MGASQDAAANNAAGDVDSHDGIASHDRFTIFQQPKMTEVVQEDCAVLIGGVDGPVFAGKQLGVSDVGCYLMARNEADKSAWLGFSIHFPVGHDNEDNGFGMCYSWSESHGKPLPAKTHGVTAKFPRTNVLRVITPADAGVRSRFPDEKRDLSLVEVFLEENVQVVVEGYGLPFANKGHIAEKWLHENAPIVSELTLMGLLEQRSFHFVVASEHDRLRQNWDFGLLPPRFSYPYGTDHGWKGSGTYEKMLTEHRGRQFAPRRSFDTMDELLTVMSQSQVQDIMWVEWAAEKIRATGLSAYFIPATNGMAEEEEVYFAIVAAPQEFRNTFKSAWHRLARDGRLKILLHDKINTTVSPGDSIGRWDAVIVERSSLGDSLRAHPTKAHELVLHVRKRRHARERGPIPNISKFQPFNPTVFGLTSELRESEPAAARRVVNRLRFRMQVQRDLLLGTGFYDTLRGKPAGGELAAALAELSLDSALSRVPRPLPTVKLLDVRKGDFVRALMQEVLPPDRHRFIEYLRSRPLGLGIITAPPGFGKTTALAVGAVAMADALGKLYLSGPTHVSVDNAAARLDVVCGRVTKRLNDKLGQQQDGSPRYHRKLIIRAYKMEDELKAFKTLLRNPRAGDNAAPQSKWKPDSKWKLNLSLAYWALVMLGAPTVRQLGPDDKQALHAIRDSRNGRMATDDEIRGIMEAVIHVADVLATTPALACREPFCAWKNDRAQGFVIDEAAGMNWPDLLCVWGNTCMPNLLAGDEKQLPPAVMTKNERDGEGNFFNRFARDGALSPIHHLKSMGWPIYRLRVQLRMAAGQFDLTWNEVYQDVPFTYGPGCEIDLPQHKDGRQLEIYLRSKFSDIKACPPGELRPVFIHCEGSRSLRDEFSRSIKNPDQVAVALRLLVEFVKICGARPEDLVVISPYSANINTIEQLRKRREFAGLQPMRPAATVDSFQGQEGTIVMVIMGTTVSSGPGHTCDEQRLNVLLSRHKSGLIIVGDVNVTGDVTSKIPPKDMLIISESGEESYEKRNMLRNIHFALQAAGRVAKVRVSGN
ncbi:uncharacterized protein MAM_02621 [Metarhizium album ARSEF 1941]|uniref:DNA2/NAM7 helicase-like C-terminal domain-containing protein n=1 Tax=Metarhizium album (strain ARSEF 1941) TaxID=1081103 RepID=A0A0B2X0H1_METAS|nr:uncharacterized protein MAM_02621 [Metarhizium album ARSEF 1941]KHN99768.1 hypothetical protein MAM_02621 [Metarhizium album ARSEF 1941]